MNLGSKLKKRRLELNLTQSDVAKKLFVSPQTISRWELNQSTPSIHFILEISSLYNVSLDYLLKGDEQVKKTYKRENVKLKFAATIVLILYFVLFTFLIIMNINKNVKSVPINEITVEDLPKKLSTDKNLKLKFNQKNIEGVDSEYADGILYIVILYKPILLFNSTDNLSVPLDEITKVNNISIDDIKEIKVVQLDNGKYNKMIDLSKLPQQKNIYMEE